MVKSPADAVTHGLPAASARAPCSEDPEAVRPGPRRVLSAARAALVAAGEEAHASRETKGPRAAAAARLGKS